MGVEFKFTGSSKLLRSIYNNNPQEFMRELRDKFAARAIAEIPPLIIEELSKGNTPVQDGEFKKTYSDSYKEQIKRYHSTKYNKSNQPVNLKLSGYLHKTLIAEKEGVGVRFKFKSPIARFHDIDGAGKSKVIRRMLPRGGETFNKRISSKIKSIISEVLKGFVR